MSSYFTHFSSTGQHKNPFASKIWPSDQRLFYDTHNKYPQKRSNEPKKTLEDLPSIISQFKEISFGVDYVYGLSVDKFFCVLCDKNFHMNLIGGHVAGNSHRRKYCEKHFPKLSIILENFNDNGQCGYVSILLALIASQLKSFDNAKQLPQVYDHNLSEEEIESIKNHHLNLDHVSQNTEDLERALIDIVLEHIEQNAVNTSKDVNVKINHQSIINSQYSESSSSLRAFQFNDLDCNVVSIFNNFDKLRFNFNIDSYKFDQLYHNAFDLESTEKNFSNILLQNHDIKVFILTEFKKIISTQFDHGKYKNLVEYTKFMINKLIPEADSLNVSVQVACPDPPSVDIFANTHEEENENLNKAENIGEAAAKFHDSNLNQRQSDAAFQFPTFTQHFQPVVYSLPIIQLLNTNQSSNYVYISSLNPLPKNISFQAYNTTTNQIEWFDACFVGVTE